MKKLRVLFLAVVLTGTMTGCLFTSKDSGAEPQQEENDTSLDSAIQDKDQETHDSQLQAAADGKINDTAAVYVSDKTVEALEALDTDYTKIAWGVIYTPADDEEIVISIAPYNDGENYYIVVGVTNLYDKDITFEGSGYAKNNEDENVGDIEIKADNIGPGSTIITCVKCEAGANGAIHWDSVEFKECESKYVYWESDWALGQSDDGSVGLNYKIEGEEDLSAVKVSALVLNESGFIIGYGESDDAQIDGTVAGGVIDFHAKEFLDTVADVAVFANPVK